MKKIVIGDIISRAWDLAVKHWPIFVLFSLLTSVAVSLGRSYDMDALSAVGQNTDPQVLTRALREAMELNSPLMFIGVLLAMYLSFIVYRMCANVIRNGKPYESMGEVFRVDIAQLAVYLCVGVVYSIAVTIGTVLCILPGIFIGVRWMYAPILVITDNANFVDAFSRSWQMTQGSFWDLFLLGLAAIGIAILGICACCVGVYFAEVIIQFMLVLSFFALRADEAPAQTEDYIEVQ